MSRIGIQESRMLLFRFRFAFSQTVNTFISVAADYRFLRSETPIFAQRKSYEKRNDNGSVRLSFHLGRGTGIPCGMCGAADRLAIASGHVYFRSSGARVGAAGQIRHAHGRNPRGRMADVSRFPRAHYVWLGILRASLPLLWRSALSLYGTTHARSIPSADFFTRWHTPNLAPAREVTPRLSGVKRRCCQVRLKLSFLLRSCLTAAK